MNKICIIGVYFGKLPNYFSLWLKSAEYNSTVDFYVFTNQKLENLPKNVYCIDFSLEEIKRRVNDIVGFEVCLNSPYKCCDYKVIYGLIFKDYIEKYDYWGHTDFDLIYGDLQYFFDKYDLYSYDKFLWLGHLSLYKNTEKVNNYYKLDGSKYNYKQVFTTPDIYAFDEEACLVSIYQKNNLPIFLDKVFLDISARRKRYLQITTSLKGEKIKNYKHQTFYWENGKIYRVYLEGKEIFKEEYLYMHFKCRPNFTVNFNAENCSAFYITNKGFIEKHGQVTKQNIYKYNKYHGWLYEWFENVWQDVKHYYKRVINKIKRVFCK